MNGDVFHLVIEESGALKLMARTELCGTTQPYDDGESLRGRWVAHLTDEEEMLDHYARAASKAFALMIVDRLRFERDWVRNGGTVTADPRSRGDE